MVGDSEWATGCPSSTRRAGTRATARAVIPSTGGALARKPIDSSTNLRVQFLYRRAIDREVAAERIVHCPAVRAPRCEVREEIRLACPAERLYSLEVVRAHDQYEVCSSH